MWPFPFSYWITGKCQESQEKKQDSQNNERIGGREGAMGTNYLLIGRKYYNVL